MGTDFSNPKWWPTPPPKAPRKISTATIVFGTIVPVVILVIVIVAIAGQKKHASAAEGRSLVAFQACMKSEGATSPTERSNSRFLEQDAESCREHLPKGMAVPSFAPPSGSDQAAQRAFAECMQAATANISRRAAGPFGGSSARNAFRNAIATCRSLVGQQGSGQIAPPPQTTTTTAVA